MKTYYFRHKGFKDCILEVTAKDTDQAFKKIKAVVAQPRAWLLFYIWVNKE